MKLKKNWWNILIINFFVWINLKKFQLIIYEFYNFIDFLDFFQYAYNELRHSLRKNVWWFQKWYLERNIQLVIWGRIMGNY